ncbi:SEP-domain-containing protein [Pseudovirgaria hyperparasitica]|uniref:SEP-domain-containing protein n=1 Tax=Pseudovirgaria hyperparasitica TaxID=470096 RepID=A0A6A6VXL9_9PEZI|nr:SEP-domain-containing protein [Pseudovirgaria hyperparasitica]KAF2754001.1 SEP-domain-containing protein [Pseudovirgaria hyperparasitica]
MTSEQNDALISQFIAVAGPSVQPEQAQGYLAAASWNVEEALQTFFAANDGEEQDTSEEQEAAYTGPRTLDGRPAPGYAGEATSMPSSSARGKQPQKGGLRTLKDIQGDSGHSHDDEDDEDDDKDQDMFAGGEKSGLAVQNPGQSSDPQAQIRDMLKKAQRNDPRPGGEDTDRPRPRFTGTGQTLGGDDTPSRVVTQASPQRPVVAAPERRDLHIWRNGFSVDDGPLYRYDDPANAGYLEMINRGQAPVQLMNAQHGQELDVHLSMHKEDDYVKPKAKYKPFGGSGQRLGSPTPGASGPAAATSSAPPPTQSTTATPPGSSAPIIDVDEAQPTLALQIRLGDGTRLRSRFNASHTIGDVYTFVNSASPTSAQRPWALMTTFPSKELSDKTLKLGDVEDLKRGGVVVQKWT